VGATVAVALPALLLTLAARRPPAAEALEPAG
jgi:hypothetical protein